LSTKIHAAVDALGNPVRLLLTGGQISDYQKADDLIEGFQADYVIVPTKDMIQTPLYRPSIARERRQSSRHAATARKCVPMTKSYIKTGIWLSVYFKN